MKKLQIPVGISDFTKIREQGYYYVDKTGLISDLLEDIAEVTLITPPPVREDHGYEYAGQLL